MIARSIARAGQRFLARYVPGLDYYASYWFASRRLGDGAGARERGFEALVRRGREQRCLQIGVRDAKYDAHWVSVDLYDDSPLIDFHYDIHELEFAPESFDIIVCRAILEHVEDPQRAIAELGRVLAKGGEIWVEVPFNQPYHPSPGDYWRVTPEGLRLWMKAFSEVDCRLFPIRGSVIYNGVYVHGTK